MNFNNLAEEIEEVQEKTTKVTKRIPVLVGSYDEAIKEFKIHCLSNCGEPKFVNIVGKNIIRCKTCLSEINKFFIERIKEILVDAKIDSPPFEFTDADGQNAVMHVIKINGTVKEFTLAPKKCILCKNKKLFCNASKNKKTGMQTIYNRCVCGVRTYENLASTKYFTDAFDEDAIEKIFAPI